MKTNIESILKSKNRLILIAIYFSTVLVMWDKIGPYEGSQSELTLGAPFSDWWGVVAPIFPNLLNLGNSKGAWIIFYLFILAGICTGLNLIIPIIDESTILNKSLNFFLHYLIIIFVLVGGRDGILLGLTVFGLGLITGGMPTHKTTKLALGIIGWFSILLATQFKLPGITVVVASLLIFGIRMNSPISKKITIVTLGILVIPTSLILTSQLREHFNFDQTFPEQQVMFNDLSGIYCWSPSERAREVAGESIANFQRTSVSERELCASMVPYGWDNLRLPWIDWKKNRPIIQISANNYQSFKTLKENWLTTIQTFPEEWIAFKINLMGQVLFMSNSYEPLKKYIFRSQDKQQFLLRLIFLTPILIVESINGLTFFASFLLCTILMIRSKNNRLQLGPLVFLSAGFITILFTYVANNGRYVAPYTLLYFVMELHNLRGLHKPQPAI